MDLWRAQHARGEDHGHDFRRLLNFDVAVGVILLFNWRFTTLYSALSPPPTLLSINLLYMPLLMLPFYGRIMARPESGDVKRIYKAANEALGDSWRRGNMATDDAAPAQVKARRASVVRRWTMLEISRFPFGSVPC